MGMDTQMTKMTIQAAAAHLKVSEKTIRRRIKDKRLQASKTDGRWLVHVEMDEEQDTDLATDRTDDQPVPDELLHQMRQEVKYLREMLDRKDAQIDQQNQLIAMTTQQNGQLLTRRPAPRPSMGERVGRWMDRLREGVASL